MVSKVIILFNLRAFFEVLAMSVAGIESLSGFARWNGKAVETEEAVSIWWGASER